MFIYIPSSGWTAYRENAARKTQACAARDTVDRLLVRIRFSERLTLRIRRLTDGSKRLQMIADFTYSLFRVIFITQHKK